MNCYEKPESPLPVVTLIVAVHNSLENNGAMVAGQWSQTEIWVHIIAQFQDNMALHYN